MNSSDCLRHFNITGQPAQAPPPGYMNLTIVGSGVSTGVPVIGHLGRGCACEDAIANPGGPNSRNNISLLITLPRRDAPDLPEEQRVLSTVKTVSETTGKKTGENCGNERGASATGSLMSTTPGSSHARFAVKGTVNYIGTKPVAHILIDCGKTFRDAYFRVMMWCNVRRVDTLLLTHGHADAIAGLDDLRDLQPMHMLPDGDWIVDDFVPTYLTPTTLETLKKSVGYIIQNSLESGRAMATPGEHAAQASECVRRQEGYAVANGKANKEGGWRNIGIRRSTALDIFCMDEEQPSRMHLPITTTAATAAGPVEVGGAEVDLPFFSFPVEHGKGYTSMAWVFGRGTAFKSQQAQSARQEEPQGSCVVYISDVSDIPPTSMAFLQDLVKIDVLFLDCLAPAGRTSPVHYCEDDLMALVLALKPRHVFGVGMHCALKHNEWAANLANALQCHVAAGRVHASEVQSVELAYDGMRIVLPQ